MSKHTDRLKFLRLALIDTNDILTFSFNRENFLKSVEEIIDDEEFEDVIHNASADICELRDNVELLEHAFDSIRQHLERDTPSTKLSLKDTPMKRTK